MSYSIKADFLRLLLTLYDPSLPSGSFSLLTNTHYIDFYEEVYTVRLLFTTVRLGFTTVRRRVENKQRSNSLKADSSRFVPRLTGH